eukprot:scaffold33624_cov63-Phaeocystis_antarctica.AAC.4
MRNDLPLHGGQAQRHKRKARGLPPARRSRKGIPNHMFGQESAPSAPAAAERDRLRRRSRSRRRRAALPPPPCRSCCH